MIFAIFFQDALASVFSIPFFANAVTQFPLVTAIAGNPVAFVGVFGLIALVATYGKLQNQGQPGVG